MEHSDCPRPMEKGKKKRKKLAVTTLRSDLLNFRRGSRRAKRLREMESETVEGLVSAETRRSSL